jgi:hypothetical protein
LPSAWQQICPDPQHEGPQQVWPVAHVAPASTHGMGLQVASQYVPGAQWTPHPPQCSGLLKVLTQVPAQQIRPDCPHAASHPPPLELAPPLDDPLLALPELPLLLLDVPPPLELPEPEPPPLDDDEDEEEPVSSDVPSVEASTPELNVEPPHAAPATAIAQAAVAAVRIFGIVISSFERPCFSP